MVDKTDSVREEYEGPRIGSGSLSLWAAGHLIGIPIGGAVGALMGKNEGLHQSVVRMWESAKGMSAAILEKVASVLPVSSEKIVATNRIGAYALSGAVAGTAIFSVLGWAIGSGAEVRGVIRGRAQFDRLQDRIQALSEENAALQTKAAALLEQLKTAQTPTHAVSHVEAHEKHMPTNKEHAKHDSHVAALATDNTATHAAR